MVLLHVLGASHQIFKCIDIVIQRGIGTWSSPEHICIDVVEAHCYVVDIGRTGRKQIRSRINNN